MEEQQYAVLKRSMQNVEQEVMRAQEDADNRLRTDTVKYMYEADACQTNLRMYREEIFAREEGMEILRAGSLDLRQLGDNAERESYSANTNNFLMLRPRPDQFMQNERRWSTKFLRLAMKETVHLRVFAI